MRIAMAAALCGSLFAFIASAQDKTSSVDPTFPAPLPSDFVHFNSWDLEVPQMGAIGKLYAADNGSVDRFILENIEDENPVRRKKNESEAFSKLNDVLDSISDRNVMMSLPPFKVGFSGIDEDSGKFYFGGPFLMDYQVGELYTRKGQKGVAKVLVAYPPPFVSPQHPLDGDYYRFASDLMADYYEKNPGEWSDKSSSNIYRNFSLYRQVAVFPDFDDTVLEVLFDKVDQRNLFMQIDCEFVKPQNPDTIRYEFVLFCVPNRIRFGSMGANSIEWIASAFWDGSAFQFLDQ